jgi:type II secretory pathway component PulK
MRRSGERGIVLVAVLLMVAIMSVLVVAVTSLTRSGVAVQKLEQRRLATHLALRSGLESAKALILSTPEDQRVYFSGAPVVLEIGGGIEAEVTIRDAAGLVDLNRTDLKLIDAMLMSGLAKAGAETISSRIAEWRNKAEEKMKTEAQAQAATPATQPAAGTDGAAKPQPPAPVIFLATDQLLALAEAEKLEAEEARALASRFTVFNPTGQLNPLAADDDVLLSVPGMMPEDLAALAAARRSRAPDALAGLGQMVERLKPYLTLAPPTVFVIDVRLLSGPGIIAQSRAGAVAQVVDKGPLPFQTLWVSGS